VMEWLIEAERDCGGRFSWISIPGVALTISSIALP